MYKEKIVNAITGEETWRDYTAEEVAKVEKDQQELAILISQQEQKLAARQAVLAKLGLTAEDISALGL